MSEFVLIGRVVKAHGIRGEVVVDVLSDVPDRFAADAEVQLDGRPTRIVSSRPHQGRLLVRFDGVDDRTAAELLRGRRIEAPPVDLDNEDTYYAHELVGMEVVDADDLLLGMVSALIELPDAAGYDLLEVRREDGSSWLLPAVDEYVEVTEHEGRERLTVTGAPAGLLSPDHAEEDHPGGRRVVSRPVQRLDVLTIFPEWFQGPLTTSLLGKAAAAGVLDLRVHDLRDWTTDRHRTVDDAPYGGGAGMVMRADVWINAAEAVWNDLPATATAGRADPPDGARYLAGGVRPRTLLLTPRGRPLTQAYARDLAAEERLVLLCGRYEGIDERVHDLVATDEVSIGDYVLFGGEVAAAVVLEAVTRLLPGVVGNEASPEDESFTSGLLEYPHYTRPAIVRDEGVPDVLTSGDHGAVAAWRHEQAERLTRERRPDLLG